jgi:hypothetical protein
VSQDPRMLDNVGLWEYLVAPASCVDSGVTGRAATHAMADCVEGGSLLFREELLESPRFAVVPLLDYIHCEGSASDPDCLQGGEWLDITGYVPVYLQGAWFTCGTPTYDCLFAPVDFEDGEYTDVFYPGEGDADPVIPKAGGYVRPSKVNIKGLSSFVLDWAWLTPPDAEDLLGESFPFQVFLYR